MLSKDNTLSHLRGLASSLVCYRVRIPFLMNGNYYQSHHPVSTTHRPVSKPFFRQRVLKQLSSPSLPVRVIRHFPADGYKCYNGRHGHQDLSAQAMKIQATVNGQVVNNTLVEQAPQLRFVSSRPSHSLSQPGCDRPQLASYPF